MNKKAKITYMFSVITWLLISSSAIIFSKIISSWHGLLIGLSTMFIALIIHLIARANNPKLFIISTCFNAIATGIAMSSYYACFKIDLPPYILAATLLSYVILSYLICMGV